MNIQVDDLEEHCFVLSEHTQLQRGQVSGNYVRRPPFINGAFIYFPT